MNYRRLGRSGLKVSEISLGSWTTYGGSVDKADAARIIHRAFDLGINLFDTADVYVRGGAESVLGRSLQGLPREQLVIATKCMGRVWDGPLGGGLSRKHIFDALHQSLKRLGVDYVDLYQLHAPDLNTPLEETLKTFEDLVRSGKVRYIGYSNYDRHPPLDRDVLEIQKAHGWDLMTSSQPRLSLLDRHVEEGHLDLCRRDGLGLIVYSPLAQGVLTNKYAGGAVPHGSRATTPFAHFLTQEQALTPVNVAAAERFAAWVKKRGLGRPAPVALAWVLSHPEVSSAIIGATRIEQLEENVTACDLKLSDELLREAEAVVAASAQKPAAARSDKAAAARPGKAGAAQAPATRAEKARAAQAPAARPERARATKPPTPRPARARRPKR